MQNAPQWFLDISENDRPPRAVPAQPGVVFGRTRPSTCMLDDLSVSGQHAQIVEDREGRLWIEDLGSENKTRIHGGPTLGQGEVCILVPGMVIRLGRAQVVVRSDDEDEETDIDISELTTVPFVPREDLSDQPTAPALPVPAIADSDDIDVNVDADADDEPDSRTIDLHQRQGPYEHLATEGSLRSAKARLVIAGKAGRRAVPIEIPDFVIGRHDTESCAIVHPAISSPHAKIVFDGEHQRFFVEDCGSRNHTYLNGTVVAPGTRQELTSDAHLRFGPIDTLFVVDTDHEGHALSREAYARAARILLQNGSLSAAQKRAVKSGVQSGGHVGQALLLCSNPISVRQWIVALEQAKLLGLTESARSRSLLKIGLLAGALALAAAATVFFLR